MTPGKRRRKTAAEGLPIPPGAEAVCVERMVRRVREEIMGTMQEAWDYMGATSGRDLTLAYALESAAAPQHWHYIRPWFSELLVSGPRADGGIAGLP